KQRYGDAIHLGFDYNWDFLVRQQSRDSRTKIRDLLFGVSVVEAKHRHSMRNLGERFQRLSAHVLRRRIWSNEVWELRFKIDKLAVQPVVLAVADYRCGLLVIEAIVLPDVLLQLCDALCRLLLIKRHAASYKRQTSRQCSRAKKFSE